MMEKKINSILFLLILLNFIFLFNFFYGEELRFDILAKDFYKSININYSISDSFFINKNKVLIINLFNVVLPLIVLSFCKNLNFNFDKFKYFSLQLCNIYLFFLFLFIIYKLILVQINTIRYNEMYINIHSMIYILNLHFALILDSLFNSKKELKLNNIIKLILIIICFILSDSFIHLFICFLTAVFYSLRFDINTKYFLYVTVLFFVLLFFSFCKIIYFDIDQTFKSFDYFEPGSSINALYVRIMNARYFLEHSDNLNLFIGNNIFTNNIYTYPHNIFLDILISTGLFGIVIFLLLSIKLIKNIRLNLNNKNFFFLIALTQSFIFSNLSGYLFLNTIFNIVLATCLCFFTEKDFFIKKNS